MVDSTYIGAFGRIKAMKSLFLGREFMAQLLEHEASDYLSSLSGTDYRKELDELSLQYKDSELVDAVVSAHTRRLVGYMINAAPATAKAMVRAYVGSWDIRAIKTVVSARLLDKKVTISGGFIIVDGKLSAAVMGAIPTEEFAAISEQKEIDGMVDMLVKYGYGGVMLQSVEETKKNRNASQMFMALDGFYFSNLVKSFRFYRGDEGPMLQFIRDSIDVKNVMDAIKSSIAGFSGLSEYIVQGGNMGPERIAEIASKKVEDTKDSMPFRIDAAYDAYKEDGLLAYFESALRRELYGKYLGIFERSALSVLQLIAFIMRAEMEADELRLIWFGKRYGIGEGRYKNLSMLNNVVK